MNQDESITFKGKGIFSSDNDRVESPFILQRQFSHTILLIQEEGAVNPFSNKFNISNTYSLFGQLEDGRSISADNLMIAKTGGSEGLTEIFPSTGVVIGQADSLQLVKAQYPLVGLFDGKFSIEYSGWKIEILDSDQDSSVAERRSKQWQIPIEGLTLRLANPQKTLEEYHEKARDVMSLLSLATGNGVTSHRQIADWGDHGKVEVWRNMTGDEIGPGPIVPSFRLGEFLKHALPVWEKWDFDKKSDVRLAISYINLSATGYLDTRIFQISQAWEFIATSWMPKGELNDNESNLRTRIKASYREWRKENPDADPNGCWGGRITFPFQWPLAKRQMESLAASRSIDFLKIGFDLENLKEARDSVAHTGKINKQTVSNPKDNYHLLSAAQFGLQLVLIAELEYSGLVASSSGGWKTHVPIDNFFIKAGRSELPPIKRLK